MAERRRLGLQQVRALKPGQVIWDGTLPGFGARRQTGPGVAYVLLYRTAEGRQRWHTIGRHGAPWTPDTAREEAKAILGRVVKGADPAAEKQARRTAATVTELCDAYMADAESGRLMTRRRAAKKESTLASDRSRVEGHIKPLLGAKPVASITREDIEDFMHAVADGETARAKTSGRGAGVRGGMGTASRTVGLLGAIFTYAVRRRMRADNPVVGVVRPADGRRERRLGDDEYKALGDALRALDGDMWPGALAMCRFLALTGWRSGEAQAVRWEDIDLVRRTATLPDTKSGRSVRPLSRVACAVLRTMGGGKGLVFPATRGDGRMTGWPKLWARIARKAELPSDVTPHVLRHSLASLAGDMGYSEPTIAALIGHKGASITSRYIHAADAVLLSAADAVADRTAELMGDAKQVGEVIPLRPMTA